MIGVHPDNRDSYLLSEQRVHSIIEEVFENGWVWSAIKDPVVFEDGPDQKCQEATRKATEGNPRLSQHWHSVKFGAVDCTHTNHSLNCINDGVEHDNQAMTEGGRLSRQKFSKKNKQIDVAIESGLTWTVIRHSAEEMYPTLPALIQKSRNKVAQATKASTIGQCLSMIENMVTSMIDKGDVD